MKKAFALVEVLVVVILIAVASGIFYFFGQRSSQVTPSSQPSSTPKAMMEDKMSGWKTYTNSLQNYTIKYPSTYVVDPKSQENDISIFYSSQAVLDRTSQYPTPSELEITIYSEEYSTNPPKKYTSLLNYIDTQSQTDSSIVAANITWVTINNVEVAKEKMGDTDRYYWLGTNGYIYLIDVQPNNSSLKNEADLILSTFEFTN